jgi:formamidopyrimidine-DNA glycosylase
MPELPEVETTLRAIDSFSGKKILSSKVNNPNLRWKIDKNFDSMVRNVQIKNIHRRAKYIIFSFKEFHLLLHLGMSGSIRIAKKSSNYFKRHDHVELVFKNKKIIYNDPRRFGSMHIIEDLDSHFLLKNLGPEPLSKKFNSKYLNHLCSSSKTSIKSFIMNQKNVVGVGNIYASESLFIAQINPLRSASSLKPDECNALVKSIKAILRKAIDAGGTTLKDFYSADGNAGYFKIKLNVYDRENKECKKCDELIKKITQNQRATYYCSKCQF